MKEPYVAVVITAGGRGKRFLENENGVPKQFRPLRGVPIIRRTIDAFEKIAFINEIIVSLPPDFMREDLKSGKVKDIVPGGSDRQASVYAALRRVSKQTDIVLIHDGVRPFVTEAITRRVVTCAQTGCAAIAGVKATDTVKQTDADGSVLATPDRNGLWMVQTPQGFAYDVIMGAHAMAQAEGFTGTDDGMLVERYGLTPVKMVEGGRENIKITTPFDMKIAEMYIKETI